jgi:acyl carrier protein
MTPTFDRMCSLLMREYLVPQDRLTPATPLAGLGIDSLGVVELLWSLEDTFHITLPTDAVEFGTLGDVVSCIDARVAMQRASATQDLRAASTSLGPP